MSSKGVLDVSKPIPLLRHEALDLVYAAVLGIENVCAELGDPRDLQRENIKRIHSDVASIEKRAKRAREVLEALFVADPESDPIP